MTTTGGGASWTGAPALARRRAWTLEGLLRAAAERPAILLLALACYAFAFQGSRGLWEPDEGRYTAVALEMERLGDYLLPRLNHESIHLTKPPLTYWLLAASFHALGHNEWAARLPNALAFILTVVVVARLARRLTPRTPLLPPLIYATSLLPVASANIVTTDTVLALWEAIAVWAFAEIAWGDPAGAGRYRLLLWSALGLAFLTKGPPALIPLIPIAIWAATTGGWREARRLVSLPAVLLFAVVGLSWYVVIIATVPGALSYLLGTEVYERMFTADLDRNAGWLGPFRAYGPVVLLGALPWMGQLVRGVRGARRWIEPQWWRDRRAGDPVGWFLSLWLIGPFVLFVIARSRMPLYLLPLAVPLSFLLARVAGDIDVRGRRIVIVGAWIVFIVFARGALARLEGSKDARSLARAIAASEPAQPREVVFVETHARNGVSLYLDAEVERVAMYPPVPGKPIYQPLRDELAEKEDGRVFVVSSPHLHAFLDHMGELGQPVEQRGGWRDLSFFWPAR